jgi:hypothetical protein
MSFFMILSPSTAGSTVLDFRQPSALRVPKNLPDPTTFSVEVRPVPRRPPNAKRQSFLGSAVCNVHYVPGATVVAGDYFFFFFFLPPPA